GGAAVAHRHRLRKDNMQGSEHGTRPREATPPRDRGLRGRDSDPQKSRAEALRLFLIEDDDDIALLIRKSLQRAGHHVTRGRFAADALIVLSHSTFDLLILDLVLPDMPDGLELLERLNRQGISVPTLIITGHGDEQLAIRAMLAGALDYIVKDQALTFL